MAANRRRDSRNLPTKSNSDNHRDPQVLNPEIMTGNEPRITQRTFQIVVEKHNPEDVKTLMTAERDDYRERLKLNREHAEHHLRFKK